MSTPPGPAANPPPPPDPLALLRSRKYLVLLVFSALIGVPVAIAAAVFLRLVNECQEWVFQTLPDTLGFDSTPTWWPLPVLMLAGLLVALVIQRLPGNGGHSPAQGLKATGTPTAPELPGIALAAFLTLGLGAVLGPEAPLIAIGGGLAALAVHLAAKNAPAQAALVIGAAGSFAAIATLLGSPLVGAFLLMEIVGIAGPMLGIILVPGLLAAGIGALVFIGTDNITGLGTFSLAIPDIPPAEPITAGQFLWAIAIGVLAAVVGTAIKRGAQALEPLVVRHRLVITPILGAVVAVAAIVFQQATDKGADQVLFSGESTMAGLVEQAGAWTVGALVLLVLCKSVAYGVSLAGFRGGPTFPAMFIGVAGGIALSHLPGLPTIAAVAMGIGAMAVTMLGLPLTSVLLASVFLQADGISLMPLVIVSVVTAYVTSARLTPEPRPAAADPAAAASSA